MAKKQAKPRICLGCWDEALAADHAAALKRDGFEVSVVGRGMSGWITYFRDLDPAAVVIDLDRLPSHGREVGMILQASKTTCHLPLVYLGGLPEKVDRIRQEHPDAVYAEWKDAASAIKKAIANPGADRFAGSMQRSAPLPRDAHVDLARRLGIAPGLQIVTWGDTDSLLGLLDPLPDGVSIGSSKSLRQKEPGSQTRLWLCVTRSLSDVEAAFDVLVSSSHEDQHEKVSAWIVHPKQSSRYRTDFNQNDVRDAGLARGWVDFKVCAIDQDWSGLKFAPRKTARL